MVDALKKVLVRHPEYNKLVRVVGNRVYQHCSDCGSWIEIGRRGREWERHMQEELERNQSKFIRSLMVEFPFVSKKEIERRLGKDFGKRKRKWWYLF